jgi:hypothetical protein
MGKVDEAKEAYDRALKIMSDSNLSAEIKTNATVFNHYNLARVALGKKVLPTANEELGVQIKQPS